MCVCISAGRQEDVQKRLVKQPIHTTVHVIYDMHINHARITKKKTKQNKTKQNKTKKHVAYIYIPYIAYCLLLCALYTAYIYMFALCVYVCMYIKRPKRNGNLLDGCPVVIDSGFPTAVVFLNVSVIVVHLGVIG